MTNHKFQFWSSRTHWGTKKIVAQLGENTFQVFTETQSMAIKKVSEGWGSKPHILTLCANDMNSHICGAMPLYNLQLKMNSSSRCHKKPGLQIPKSYFKN